MLEYIDLALKVVIAVNLTYFTFDYTRCKRLYSKFKSLYTKMSDLQTILNNETSPATAETTNYKDRLCAVLSGGDSKKYLGKEYTIKDIEALSPADREKLFQRYQIKFGSELVTTVTTILSLYARAIGLTLPVELFGIKVSLGSEERLTEDLSNDPIINNGLASALSEVCYKYGIYLSPLVATLITAKHLNFKKDKNYSIVNNDGPSRATASSTGIEHADRDSHETRR